jgi:DNA-binding protein H-NS
MPTLEQIHARMKKLQSQAESLIAKRAQSVLSEIHKLMDQHGLTTADIDSHSSTKRKPGRQAGKAPSGATLRKKVAKSATAQKGKLPAKYRDPKTGLTWSGHARPPQWIKAVKDRSVFLIDGSGTSTSALSKPAGKRAAVKKTAVKARAVKKARASASRKTVAKKAAAKQAAAVESVAIAA